MIYKCREKWKVNCFPRIFCIEDEVEVELQLEQIEKSILVSCVLEGRYETQKKNIPFLKTESVPLCIGNGKESISVKYSTIIPSDMSPSYTGVNLRVSYYLNVTAHKKEEVSTISIPIQFWSKKYCTVMESKECVLISAMYISVKDKENQVGTSLPKEVVKVLRVLRSKRKKEISAYDAVQRIENAGLKEALLKLIAIEKESEAKDLSVIYALKKKEYPYLGRSTYSVKKEGKEIAFISLTLSTEYFPHWNISIKVHFSIEGSTFRATLFHVERTDKEKKQSFCSEEKSISNCTYLNIAIPFSSYLYPMIDTPYFKSSIELKLEIDSFSAAINIGERLKWNS